MEIPRPSARLSEVLGAENHEQVRRLNAEPGLRRELETLSLAISAEQGASLRNIHERTRALQDRALRQSRELARSNPLDIRR